MTASTEQDTRRRRTVVWVVSLATLGMVFDGYDLVAYGAVVPTFLKDPSQLGEVTPALAGTLGSYALLGMLFGALLAGAVGDIVGRRRVMLTAYAWFSVGMAVHRVHACVREALAPVARRPGHSERNVKPNAAGSITGPSAHR